jgi:hypothetical protein
MVMFEQSLCSIEWQTLGAVRNAAPPTRHKLSVPSHNKTLSAAVEDRAKHIRVAIELIAKGITLTSPQQLGYFTTSRDIIAETNTVPAGLRLARLVVQMWVLARIRCNESILSLYEAEAWFLGDSNFQSLLLPIDREMISEAHNSLAKLTFDESLEDLLPYLFEPHGAGSRLSVIKDPSTKISRIAKKKNGVFYTPEDVADYMVAHVVKLHGGDLKYLSCLDPACGTGVYLRSYLRYIQTRIGLLHPEELWTVISRSLFGFDIDVRAVESCAFTLLCECLRLLPKTSSPVNHWQRIRRNLVAIDATRVSKDEGLDISMSSTSKVSLTHLFPTILNGFDLIIGNPPYSPLLTTDRGDNCVSVGRKEEELTPRLNTYPLFVEMMWSLGRTDLSSASMVLPLSIAYHTGKQLRLLRQKMKQSGGAWYFAFFDREPHGLFGEDVKTRNAIIFRTRATSSQKPFSIATTGLHRLTSRTRKSLFSRLKYVELSTVGITDGIPKIATPLQADCLGALSSSGAHFSDCLKSVSSCLPSDALFDSKQSTLYVASTAYNFLTVFHGLDECDRRSDSLTSNKVISLNFDNSKAAACGIALLCSRLVYWLWHISGDGFHVTSHFIKGIPINPYRFTRVDYDSLASAGECLWTKLRKNRFVSRNGGKMTVSFNHADCELEKDEIDKILIRAAMLPEAMPSELKSYTLQTILVDENEAKRSHLRNHI